MSAPVSVIRTRLLHTRVAEELGSLIISGHYAEGEKMPVEAELASYYGVSHSVMREVTKILMAKGLVQSRPRIGTLVQDRSHWNMLDSDVLSWTIRALPETEFLEMLFNAREAFEPGVSRLAATMASSDDLDAIRAAYQDMEAARNREELLEPDLRFHLAIMDACHNPLIRNIGNALHKGLAASIAVTSRHPDTHALSLPRHRAVLQALLDRDGTEAEIATRRLLEESRNDFSALMPAATDKTKPIKT